MPTETIWSIGFVLPGRCECAFGAACISHSPHPSAVPRVTVSTIILRCHASVAAHLIGSCSWSGPDREATHIAAGPRALIDRPGPCYLHPSPRARSEDGRNPAGPVYTGKMTTPGSLAARQVVNNGHNCAWALARPPSRWRSGATLPRASRRSPLVSGRDGAPLW